MKLLEDIFMYFAKYPNRDAICNAFTLSSGDNTYEAVRTKALKASQGLFPEITDFIFGVNEESVTRRISSVKDVYMFIDFGNISSYEDSKNIKRDTFHIAVTVAKPLSSSAHDQVQELIVSDDMLEIITKIREQMRNDQSDSFINRLQFPNEITPFFARELSNSYGWTLMFKMEGIDMI